MEVIDICAEGVNVAFMRVTQGANGSSLAAPVHRSDAKVSSQEFLSNLAVFFKELGPASLKNNEPPLSLLPGSIPVFKSQVTGVSRRDWLKKFRCHVLGLSFKCRFIRLCDICKVLLV